MPELHIETKIVNNDIVVIVLSGFLDAHTFEQLDDCIDKIYSNNHFKLIADLSGVEYISSAGAGVFIGSLSVAQESEGNIILVNPTPNVREVFDLLGLTQIFTIVDSMDEAMGQFA